MTSEDERRAFETDGLTAYRKMPLAVVLPFSMHAVVGNVLEPVLFGRSLELHPVGLGVISSDKW